VDDDVEVLLGVVLGNILVGELLVGHLDCWCRCGKLSSSKRADYFFLDSCFVSTVRASAFDRRREWAQLGRAAYQEFGDLGTTDDDEDGVVTGWLEIVVRGKGAIREKDRKSPPASSGSARTRQAASAAGNFAEPLAGRPTVSGGLE
jgi:hypothetical protein